MNYNELVQEAENKISNKEYELAAQMFHDIAAQTGDIYCTKKALDLYMLFTLLHPGDERGQLVVWKASAYTLLATSGALILEVIEAVVRAQVLAVNPLVHLVVTGIIYFIALFYFRRKLGG